MNFQGLIIGAIAFLVIGIFHPIVIKSEYYIGKKVWPIFLVVGILLSIYIYKGYNTFCYYWNHRVFFIMEHT